MTKTKEVKGLLEYFLLQEPRTCTRVAGVAHRIGRGICWSHRPVSPGASRPAPWVAEPRAQPSPSERRWVSLQSGRLTLPPTQALPLVPPPPRPALVCVSSIHTGTAFLCTPSGSAHYRLAASLVLFVLAARHGVWAGLLRWGSMKACRGEACPGSRCQPVGAPASSWRLAHRFSGATDRRS